MNNTPYIGFWRRAVAFVIDGIIASIPPAVICLPMIYWQAAKMVQTEGTDQAAGHLAALIGIYLLWQLLALVSFWLYFALLESSSKQATFGKRIMGIKVIGKTGERIGFGRATGRTFAKFLSYIIMYVGFIMAGLTNRKRALHDYIAQTYVVRKDFEPGDDLPDTPSHPGWLWTVSVLMAALGLGAVLVALVQSAPAVMANTAAMRLQTFAAQPQLLQDPVELDNVVFSRRRGEFQAVFEVNGDEYLLRLKRAGEAVCCEGLNCDATPFEECN